MRVNMNELAVNKPVNLAKHGLIAIYDKGLTSKNLRDFMNMPYSINELAVNRVQEKVQVYILSDTKQGLKDFEEDYPSAELQKDAVLGNPQDWEILAFPNEPIDENSTPLDFYFHAYGKIESEDTETANLTNKQAISFDEQ